MKEEKLYQLNTVSFYFGCQKNGYVPLITHCCSLHKNMWPREVDTLVGIVNYESVVDEHDGYGIPLFYAESIPKEN